MGNCCREFEIYYESTDISRISEQNKKYKKLLENLIDTENKIVIQGITCLSKVYPTKPCPFLNSTNSKCNIQSIKPTCCKAYPFGLREDTDKSHPSYPVKITLDRCLLGTDLLIDFMIYNHSLHLFDNSIEFDFNGYYEVFLMDALKDKTQVKKLPTTEFFDIEQFKGFLFFLNTTSIDLYNKREEFKSIVISEKLNLLSKIRGSA